jgi:hypothetical protein
MTATEWLFLQLYEKFEMKGDGREMDDVLERAKKIEKEQIMKAVYDSMGTNFDPNMGRAEQYYNETYGKE